MACTPPNNEIHDVEDDIFVRAQSQITQFLLERIQVGQENSSRIPGIGSDQTHRRRGRAVIPEASISTAGASSHTSVSSAGDGSYCTAAP